MTTDTIELFLLAVHFIVYGVLVWCLYTLRLNFKAAEKRSAGTPAADNPVAPSNTTPLKDTK